MNFFGKNKEKSEDSAKLVSDETKKTSEGLFSLFNIFKKKDTDSFNLKSPTHKILGGIHEKLVEAAKVQKQEERRQKKLKDFDEELALRQHKALMRALTTRRQGPIKRKPREEKKPAEEPSKGKPAEPGKGKPEPKPEPAKAKPEPAKAKPEPAKAPPKAPPAAEPAAPSPVAPSGASTASKVLLGTGLAAASAYSFAAGPLAENIAKHESKSSSPMGKGKNKITTRWKNDTEYNAYNKGTVGKKIVGADFDEKGESLIDFSKLSIEEYLRRGYLPANNKDKLFAVGRYQIIPDTMKDLVKKLKIDPKTTFLTPETQDRIFSEGIIGQKRTKVAQYINGDPKVSRDDAILELSREFASIGVPFDIDRGKVHLKKGDSYYSGIGGNKAHNSPDDVGKALDAERLKRATYTSNGTPLKGVPSNSGQNIDAASTENADAKKDLNAQSQKNAGAGQSFPINVNVSGGSNKPVDKKDDKSAYERKKNQ